MARTQINGEAWLDTIDVAQLRGVSPERVRQWCRARRLGQLIGRQWWIRAADAQAFRPKNTGRPKKTLAAESLTA